ncbi:MAG: hypothetical protein GC136_06895 [Alphaproteobacteria bacterium]|nr:hypothetical protein [Alphaproteobacteria bacterium]
MSFIPPSGTGQIQAYLQQQALKILELPADLQHLSRPVRIDGRVVNSGNGQTTLQTEHGPVTLETKGMNFIKDQVVDLVLNAGNPPRTGALVDPRQQQSQNNASGPKQTLAGALQQQTPITTSNPQATTQSQPLAQTSQIPLPTNKLVSSTDLPVQIPATAKPLPAIPLVLGQKIIVIPVPAPLILPTGGNTGSPALPQIIIPPQSLPLSVVPQTAAPQQQSSVIANTLIAVAPTGTTSAPLPSGVPAPHVLPPVQNTAQPTVPAQQGTPTPPQTTVNAGAAATITNSPLPQTPTNIQPPTQQGATLQTPRTISQPASNAPIAPTQPSPVTTTPATALSAGQASAITTPQALQTAQPAPFVPVQTTQATATPIVLTILPAEAKQQSVQAAPAPITTTAQPLVATVTPSTPVTNSIPQNVAGQLIGTTPQGMPVFSISLSGNSQPLYFTALQPITLPQGQSSAPIPLNVTLARADVPTQNQAQTPPLTMIDLMPPLKGTGEWSSLRNLLQYLAITAPQTGQQLANIIPNLGAPQNLGAAALLILALVRGGDMKGWLDSRLPLTAKNTKDPVGAELLKLLQDDLKKISSSTTTVKHESGEWRVQQLPFLWQNEITPINIYSRFQREETEQQENTGKRFVIQLNLSRIGPLQVDGFLREQQLDTIIRTNLPFSPAMQEQLSVVYATAMQKSNLTGQIIFHGKIESWLGDDAGTPFIKHQA